MVGNLHPVNNMPWETPRPLDDKMEQTSLLYKHLSSQTSQTGFWKHCSEGHRGPSDPGQAFVQGGDVVDHAGLSLPTVGLFGPVVQEEAFGCSPVLPWHEVVDDRVDGGADVAEHHGGHVEFLAQCGCVVVAYLGKQVPANVVGQPADDESQHHHHWEQNKEQDRAVSSISNFGLKEYLDISENTPTLNLFLPKHPLSDLFSR